MSDKGKKLLLMFIVPMLTVSCIVIDALWDKF